MYSPNFAPDCMRVYSHAPGRSPGHMKGLAQIQDLPCTSGCKTKGNFRSPVKQRSKTAAGKKWKEGGVDVRPEIHLR